MPVPKVLAPLRHGPFSRYMCGEAISMTGTWMQTFAQGWLMTTLTSSAFALGVINFAAGVPMLFLTMLGGSFADRYDKRLILHAALTMQVLIAATIGYLVFRQEIAIWHVAVAATMLGITAAFEVPAVSAFVPELVPKSEMASAIALDRSVFHATRLIGPALAGYLVGALGVATAYFVNAATFLALIVAILTIPRRPAGTAEEEEQRKGPMSEGIAFVRRDRPTRIMVLMMVAMTFFASPFLMITMPIYSRNTLGLGPDMMGLLMAISGAGSFTGSLGLLSIPRAGRTLALRLAAASSTCALVGLSLAPGFTVAAASLVFFTLGLSTAFGLSNIIIQERSPDVIRGRVSAVAGMAFFGILPFSGLLISYLADWLGMRQTLMLSAVCYGIWTALLLGRSGLFDSPTPSEADIAEPVATS